MPQSRVLRTRIIPILVAAAGASILAARSEAAPPPFTFTTVARTDQVVNDIGSPITSAIYFGAGQGPGILKVAVNDTGAWVVNVHVLDTDPLYDEALLTSPLGLNPYVAEGLPGYLSAPSAGAVASGFHSLSLASSGRVGWAGGVSPGGSGAFFNTTSLAAQAGSLVNAAGLHAATTWNAFDTDSRVQITDSGRLLVVSGVTEQGVSRRVVMVLQLDGSGSVTSRTLIAKEGGLVGAGPATWVSIAGGGHASAMNSAGTVVFSGVTSSGTSGIFRSSAPGSGSFIAQEGGPTPVGGTSWGVLAGSPVDINGAGSVVFRGRQADSDTIYTETIDAGEGMDTADRTFGNGSLQRIDGVLNGDHDVDMFRIIVTNAATFSATTVPDPGSGFAGAAFDTVLTLVASPENGTLGRALCDNVSESVLQSTLSGPSTQVVTGREYYICISTPKSRPLATLRHYATNSSPTRDIFQRDPGGVAVSGGIVYWPDPSAGVIRRHSLTTGPLSDLPAQSVTPHIAVDAAAGKIYWADRGPTGNGANAKIRRCNLDGTVVEDIVTVAGFGTLTAFDTTGLALDTVNGKLYWSRSVYGEINRCNLDGTGAERVYRDYAPTDEAFPHSLALANFAPEAIAVDPAGGKVYWLNSFLNRIERANLNGTSRQTLVNGAGAAAGAGLWLDLAAGKMYWANPGAGKIQRANLDGTGIEDVLLTPAPAALTLDTATGHIYWSNLAERVIRRASTAGTGVIEVLSAGIDTGIRTPDAQGGTSPWSAWGRVGAETPGALPYQIRLTGATYRHENAMIARDATKIVAVGDVIPGTSPYKVIGIGGSNVALRMDGRGNVLWTGAFYQPTPYNNYLFGALFHNGERLLTSMDIPPGQSDKLVYFYQSPYSMDLSENGEWAMISANLQVPPFNFTPQRDHAVLLNFTLPPACPADFNGSGSVTVQDIFDFLAAYFTSAPSADVNNSGSVTVQDIFDYLALYFIGC